MVGIFPVSLTKTDYRLQANLRTIVDNYVNQRPNDVLRAVTLTVECQSDLEAQLDYVDTASVAAGRYYAHFIIETGSRQPIRTG